jgi:hypothetical protein
MVHVHEELPRGMFIDVDQLRDAERFPPSPRVVRVVPSTVEVEAPVERASNITFIWSPTWISAPCPASDGQKSFKLIRASFPIHLRYHAPQQGTWMLASGGGHRAVYLASSPQSYQCRLKNHTGVGGMQTFQLTPTLFPPLKFEVPVGNAASETFVTSMTSIIVLLATVAIVQAALFSSSAATSSSPSARRGRKKKVAR